MRIYSYPPETVHREDTALIAPFPFAGTPENTGPRLQMVANTIGATVIGFNRRGTGTRSIIDLGARRALRPANIQATYAETAEQLAETRLIERYQTLIGWGDSGGGALIMGMQQAAPLFNRLLLRDCFNHLAPQGPKEGVDNFLDYRKHGEDGKRTDPAAPHVPTVRQGRFGTLVRPLIEMYNYSPLMCSEHTLIAARDLAGSQPGLPMRIVGLTHTFTGSAGQAAAFNKDLLHRRTRSAQMLVGSGNLNAQLGGLNATVQEGYHSDLLRPDWAAKHVAETLALYPRLSQH